jgi:hypothetical protein
MVIDTKKSSFDAHIALSFSFLDVIDFYINFVMIIVGFVSKTSIAID